MFIEGATALIAAIALVLGRLDRRDDAHANVPDLRAGLLELDKFLDEWISAAVATNRTLMKYSGDTDGARAILFQQGAAASRVQGWTAPAEADEDSRALLQRFFEIYAPELAQSLRKLVDHRSWILDEIFRSSATRFAVAKSRQPEATLKDLQESLENLRQAQEQVRAFLRARFPLSS